MRKRQTEKKLKRQKKQNNVEIIDLFYKADFSLLVAKKKTSIELFYKE